MFKRISAALLLLACLLQTFNRAVILLDFYTNQKYIAQNLCENRNKPKMNCCGKCQLNKRMNKEDSKDKQNPERKNNSDEVISSKSFFASVTCFATVNAKVYSDYSSQFPQEPFSEFFHPPGA